MSFCVFVFGRAHDWELEQAYAYNAGGGEGGLIHRVRQNNRLPGHHQVLTDQESDKT